MTETALTKPSNRIAEIRKQRNISALQLAETMGVRETTIFRWQSGKHDPSINQMHKLSEILGCTLEELYPAPEGATA